MPSWDCVLSGVARQFLNSLKPLGLYNQCYRVMMTQLLVNPEQYRQSRETGEIDRLIRGWHFRYIMVSDNVIGITTIFYSPTNPNHPMNRPVTPLNKQFPNLP